MKDFPSMPAVTDQDMQRVIAVIDAFFKRIGTAYARTQIGFQIFEKGGYIKIRVRFTVANTASRYNDQVVDFCITYDSVLSEEENAEFLFQAFCSVQGSRAYTYQMPANIF